MPIECDALMLGSQQPAAHVSAHSPEADHSDLHVWCAPRVGFPELDSIGPAPAGQLLDSCFRHYERGIGKDAGGSPAPIPCARINR